MIAPIIASLNTFFSTSSISRPNIVHNSFNDKFLSGFFNIHVSDIQPYVPLFLSRTIATIGLEDRLITIPLHVKESSSKRTFQSILSYLLFDNFSICLRKCTTNKGIVYYGCQGALFDGNLQPLLMSFINLLDEHIIIKVNPSVFTSNDIVSKNIVKVALPYFASTYLDVRIENISSHVTTPELIDIDNIQENLSTLIHNNTDTIVNNALSVDLL